MTRSAISIAATFAICTGLAVQAQACSDKEPSTAGKRERQKTHVALAGRMDLNNDGKGDLDTIRRLIVMNGGHIDGELGIDGKRSGKLRRRTGLIILGELPDADTASPRVTRRFDAFMRRACRLGIPVVPLGDLSGRGDPKRSAPPPVSSLFRKRHEPKPPADAGY